MAFILQSLKEKFPQIYDLLLDNQKDNNLIFLSPNKQLYAKKSLNDKSFYYNHIFQKSRFDPTLYTNFNGKVLKSIDGKTFTTYLGWSLDMTINVIEESYNEDNLFFFQTDGICIEEDAKVAKVSDRTFIKLMKFKTYKEYIDYYSEFNVPMFKNFQRVIKSMETFLSEIFNNYILLKGFEEDFSLTLKEKINNFISACVKILRDKSIAREFVDSFIFPSIYDKIMKKMESFYSKEQAQLKREIDKNIEKYSIIELNLDSSIEDCDFDKTFKKIGNLKKYKTCFEKNNCLLDIFNSMINEIQDKYEKENEKKFEIQDDTLKSCWAYVLAKYININDAKDIYNEFLFFNYFQINKGYEKDIYISMSFISSVMLLQNELLNENDIPQIEIIKINTSD